VVNYDVPVDPLVYFHRVGRTARAGRQGKAFTFVSKEESGDFGRILKMTKAPIIPMRPEDKLPSFEPSSGGGRGGRRHGGYRYGNQGGGNRQRWRSNHGR
jgi:ATP-dependent RNA helicase DeaD